MNDKLYRAYEREHEWLEDADKKWTDDMTGTGAGLIELARESIALFAMNTTYDTEDMAQAVSELAELIELLEEHYDDYVVVNKNPMGGWDIRDYFELGSETYNGYIKAVKGE